VSTWNDGFIPSILPQNREYDIKLDVQDAEGALSKPNIQTIKTYGINLPPTVDANPQTATSYDKITVTVTADDQGENDFSHVNYVWSKSPQKPSTGWLTSYSKIFTTTQSNEGTWYLHMECFDNQGVSCYKCRGPYIVQYLTLDAKLLPNPALAGDEIIFNVHTIGNADKIEIYVDNDIIAKDSRVGKYKYPLTYNVDGTIYEKSNVFKYITCVYTDKTLNKDNIRLRGEYVLTVRAYRGNYYKDVQLKLDIRRSVLELLHPGVRSN
jgi:hypothetical protein